MGVGERQDDPSQSDLAWEGYHPRAAVPAFVFALLVTVLVLTGRWSVVDLSEIADQNGALVIFAFAWAVWPAVLMPFLYRTVTYTYRLTDRSLLVDFGMFAWQVPAVPLLEVVEVRVGTTWLSRRLGIGRIEVRTRVRAVVLIGVRQPEAFGEKIRGAAGSLRREAV